MYGWLPIPPAPALHLCFTLALTLALLHSPRSLPLCSALMSPHAASPPHHLANSQGFNQFKNRPKPAVTRSAKKRKMAAFKEAKLAARKPTFEGCV